MNSFLSSIRNSGDTINYLAENNTIIFNIVLSLIASYFFWFLSFRLSRTKVRFSPMIQKIKNKANGSALYSYRIKFINTGARDLIEISIIVKLSIALSDQSFNYTYINLGSQNIMPVLRGRRSQYKLNNKKRSKPKWPHLLVFSLPESAFKTFDKTIYTDTIQTKAQDKTLNLNDIIDEYKERIGITVFLYGNDGITGARKMFVQSYGYADIMQGRFSAFALPKNRMKYLKNAKECLALIPNDEIELKDAIRVCANAFESLIKATESNVEILEAFKALRDSILMRSDDVDDDIVLNEQHSDK